MIFDYLKKFTCSGPYYVRIRTNLISARDISNGKTVEDKPVVAIHIEGRHRNILAIGASATFKAELTDYEFTLINGFDHPRSIISDFEIAEHTMRYFISQLRDNQTFQPRPEIVIHVLEKNEGGLTDVEVRALLELAAGAGARQAYVWTGDELTDQNFKNNSFPGDHWRPEKPQWA